MKSLAFIVPVHERLALADICLRQLRRTCDALKDAGVRASAVVISDRATLDTLDPLALGFAIVERDNQFLSRRFNDGIQLACDPKFNPNPVDYVVPFGSDDWADHRLFLEPLPKDYEVQGFQHMSFVSEDGTEISSTFLNYEGGSGIRIIPHVLVAPLGYRPADEDRPRGCDTSILRNLRRYHGDRMKVKHMHIHERQIVDWKSPSAQLNSYRDVTAIRHSQTSDDPFTVLAEFYPAEALDEMQRHYIGAEAVCA
jgi:hypothetical protein